MKRQDVENTITEYLKPIFGFALKRCKSIHDAEDLSQEIVLRTFRALLAKEDVADMGKFIWTVAHNTLSNYYRDTAKSMIGVSIDEVSELIADPDSFMEEDDHTRSIHRLQMEIAYLSKLQRRIVIAYYFENRKQADIASELGIPLGTVKWHLFEAKKELKRGMDTMRKSSELKFNPIKFDSCSISGSGDLKVLDEHLRSTLSQNICYCVKNTAKTVNEIADDLGVSPVYVESEVEHLEEYGILLQQKDKFIANLIIDEYDSDFYIKQDAMYKQAAALFANDLYDELVASDLLDSPDIQGPKDKNFILWSLIPYISACSGEKLLDNSISFEEAATIRPDGAHSIINASINPQNSNVPDDYVRMRKWFGPAYCTNDTHMMWQIDSEWSDRAPVKDRNITEEHIRTLNHYNEEVVDKCLDSKFDVIWLAEHGYVKIWVNTDKKFAYSWQIVQIKSKEIRDKLLAIGERLKQKYKAVFDELKAPLDQMALDSVPAHLKKAKTFQLQFIFHSDGWFILHCIVTLLNNGKLTLPTEEQRKSLTTLIVPTK